MARLRVGVLRGGPSSEYEISLQTGAAALNALRNERVEARDIFIDRSGRWYQRGFPVEPARAIRDLDVAFNALHGEYGEDGQVQRLLDSFSIPYTGSTAVPSSVAMNKWLSKEAVQRLGIKTPAAVVLEVADDLEDRLFELFRTFPQPVVVKPINAGSSIGVTLALNYQALVEAVRRAFTYSNKILVEEYIPGLEVTCGVVDDFRGSDPYVLLPVEVVPVSRGSFFDYAGKYQGNARLYCPGNLSESQKRLVEDAARTIHHGLGLRDYSRSDFIVSRRGVHFLEVNTLPTFIPSSPFARSLQAIGSSIGQFVDHVVDLARVRAW